MQHLFGYQRRPYSADDDVDFVAAGDSADFLAVGGSSSLFAGGFLGLVGFVHGKMVGIAFPTLRPPSKCSLHILVFSNADLRCLFLNAISYIFLNF